MGPEMETAFVLQGVSQQQVCVSPPSKQNIYIFKGSWTCLSVLLEITVGFLKRLQENPFFFIILEQALLHLWGRRRYLHCVLPCQQGCEDRPKQNVRCISHDVHCGRFPLVSFRI